MHMVCVMVLGTLVSLEVMCSVVQGGCFAGKYRRGTKVTCYLYNSNQNIYFFSCIFLMLITQQFILYTIKILYFQGDMFRTSLGHLQDL